LSASSPASGVEAVVGNRLGDEPPRLGALGDDALAGHHEQLGPRHADQAHRALSAAAARDHPQSHLGKGELAPQRGDAKVAGHRQLQPGPHGISVDGRDDGLAAPLGRGQRVAPQLEVGGGQGEELGHVAAGAEGLAAGASNHDHTNALVAVEIPEDLGKLVAHGHRHRVHLGLAVDPQRGHRALPLHAQELAHSPPWGAPTWPPTPPDARTRPGGAVARLELASGCLIG
jgi:hypothetical protein